MRRPIPVFTLISCLVMCQLARAVGGEPAKSRSYTWAVDLLETWIETVVDFVRRSVARGIDGATFRLAPSLRIVGHVPVSRTDASPRAPHARVSTDVVL